MRKTDNKRVKTCFEIMRIICKKNSINEVGIGKTMDNGIYMVYCNDNKYHIMEKDGNRVCEHGRYTDAGEALRQYVYLQKLDHNFARSIKNEFITNLKTLALLQRLRGNLNVSNQ